MRDRRDLVGPAARDPPGAALSEPIFSEEDGTFVPSGHARGPWDAGSQHGGAPAALLARAVERIGAPGPMLLARMTIEFLAPVPLAPLTIRAEVVRPGRRLHLVEATLAGGEAVLCRARAVRLRRDAVAVPERALPSARLPRPDGLARWRMPDRGGEEAFGRSAMELRMVSGAFLDPGPAAAWFRFARPLVGGEDPTPLQATLAAADFGNGLSQELDLDTHLFVNTDLTVHLAREPVGEWIGLESTTELGPEGTGLAVSTLHDERGPLGRALQSLFVAPR